MACDLITEMAFITVVSVARHVRGRGERRMQGCERASTRVTSFVNRMLHNGPLFAKRTACIMTTSYSAAHVIRSWGGGGGGEGHTERASQTNEIEVAPTTENVGNLWAAASNGNYADCFANTREILGKVRSARHFRSRTRLGPIITMFPTYERIRAYWRYVPAKWKNVGNGKRLFYALRSMNMKASG